MAIPTWDGVSSESLNLYSPGKPEATRMTLSKPAALASPPVAAGGRMGKSQSCFIRKA